jgi:hypothetical protein
VVHAVLTTVLGMGRLALLCAVVAVIAVAGLLGLQRQRRQQEAGGKKGSGACHIVISGCNWLPCDDREAPPAGTAGIAGFCGRANPYYTSRFLTARAAGASRAEVIEVRFVRIVARARSVIGNAEAGAERTLQE